jgi:hypothetical protein
VRFVEDHQVVRRHCRVLQTAKHALAGQRVHAHDQQVALGSDKGIAAVARVRARHNPEREAEERLQLAPPVADQARRWDDEHPAQQLPRQLLAHVKVGHDGLAGASVIRQQEPQPVLRQHPLVDGDALVGQRLYQRDFGGERRIDQVAVLQPMRLHRQPNRLGHRRERGDGWCIGRKVCLVRPRALLHVARHALRPLSARGRGERLQPLALGARQALPGGGRWPAGTAFPAIDRREGDAEQVGELDLREAVPGAQCPDAFRTIGWHNRMCCVSLHRLRRSFGRMRLLRCMSCSAVCMLSLPSGVKCALTHPLNWLAQHHKRWVGIVISLLVGPRAGAGRMPALQRSHGSLACYERFLMSSA